MRRERRGKSATSLIQTDSDPLKRRTIALTTSTSTQTPNVSSKLHQRVYVTKEKLINSIVNYDAQR